GDNITGIIDPSGSRAWTHDAGNKISQAPYKYDANGNRTEDEKHTYKWDAENRLIQIGYKADPQKSTEFKYDGQGRRVAIIEKTGASTKETRYTWCGDTICQARDGNDQPLAYYFGEGTFRPEPGTPVSKFQGEREYYAKDHLGSVRDVLDQQGNVTASYDYDPYGKLTNSPATLPEFGYAGMQFHAPSGLYLTKYRIYEPGTGRWLSRDPIGEEGGINLYGYVGGDPLNYNDPTGEFGIVGGVLGIAINFGGQFAINLWQSDWDWRRSLRCVDYFDVVVAGIWGFYGPTGFAQGIMGKPGGGMTGREAQRAFWRNWLPGGMLIRGTNIRTDDCECKGLNLGGVLGTILQW
ncbi:MAG: RHS repeat-associated core domain-containing protein, partial [Azoarcus sp.]|nr:RHS repeat-associated core domain-containing protein [Azoarcus sp.]